MTNLPTRLEQAESGSIDTLALDDGEGHILLHSLGLTYSDEVYRNHFVTGEGSVDYPLCQSLVSKGLMVRPKGGALTGGDDVFFVTDAGKKIAAALRAQQCEKGQGDDQATRSRGEG